jgi:hypothetical protein
MLSKHWPERKPRKPAVRRADLPAEIWNRDLSKKKECWAQNRNIRSQNNGNFVLTVRGRRIFF